MTKQLVLGDYVCGIPKLLWKEAAGIYNRARVQWSVRGLEEGCERIGLPLPACPAE